MLFVSVRKNIILKGTCTQIFKLVQFFGLSKVALVEVNWPQIMEDGGLFMEVCSCPGGSNFLLENGNVFWKARFGKIVAEYGCSLNPFLYLCISFVELLIVRDA